MICSLDITLYSTTLRREKQVTVNFAICVYHINGRSLIHNLQSSCANDNSIDMRLHTCTGRGPHICYKHTHTHTSNQVIVISFIDVRSVTIFVCRSCKKNVIFNSISFQKPNPHFLYSSQNQINIHHTNKNIWTSSVW